MPKKFCVLVFFKNKEKATFYGCTDFICEKYEYIIKCQGDKIFVPKNSVNYTIRGE